MKRDDDKYVGYSIEDFVWDDAFRLWIISPDDENALFWKEWLKQHPEKTAVIEAAKQIVWSLTAKSSSINPSDIEIQVDQILMKRDAGIIPVENARIFHLNRSFLAKIAAVFVIAVGLITLIFTNKAKDRSLSTVVTTAGIQKKVMLSDSTAVILNANSKLSFRKNWSATEARELWMDGEGYFEVKHLDKDHKITGNERFLVHVNGLTVEVLGTTFNIRNRRNKTEIVLKEGSIRLSFDDRRHKDIEMKPDEIVTIDSQLKADVSTSKVKSDNYSAWIHQKLILNNTHLVDIIQYLEDNYGKKIILSDPELGNKRIDGTLLLDNLDDAVFILSKVLKVKIQQTDTSIYFIKM